MDIVITDHAYQRAKERLSLKATSIERLAEKAYSQGVAHSHAKGKLHRYMTKLFMESKYKGVMKIYGENVFVFNNNALITVWQIPKSLRAYVKFSKSDI